MVGWDHLLRAGPRLLDLTGEEVHAEFGDPGECYFIAATRSFDPGRLEIYLCPLRDPLPRIHIPLRYPDSDVPLDIQGLVNHCHQSGRYGKLDYRAPLDPPLSEDDASWVEDRLRAAGLA